MPSMTVLAATAVPDHLRGALTRWLLEVTPELYVGTVSARVRDELWNAVTATIGTGTAVLAHPANNEQGFELRTAGTQRRDPIDFDGLTLIAFQRANKEAEPSTGSRPIPTSEYPAYQE
ncbi:type I-E CRISPR-associated endoribonuclease Cas2e [Streptomyces sp. ST2-7A]|uniref:type I-E CRISPR-associated endoribonuclease Cas2e n=1 Tax=Streptomyces sp. ST2-7A TaxID=2907214 RepID=UPI001F250809|nr:type I-E CRISPR-associated endoribonuclease Cas2e [Streptomyces sp. ST2-7A]MCE7081670.1 type I-E CRISPR-associated endoribonuclease Cas2e [Streptomyces sp. ST2-7A]